MRRCIRWSPNPARYETWSLWASTVFFTRSLFAASRSLIPSLRRLIRLYAVATDLSSRTQRWSSPTDTLGDLGGEKLRAWARALPDVQAIAHVEPGRRCTVAGVVQRTRIDPVSRTIESLVTDGTGRIRVSLSLARPISEDAPLPGRAVLLSGLAVATRDGGLVIEDPCRKRIAGPTEA